MNQKKSTLQRIAGLLSAVFNPLFSLLFLYSMYMREQAAEAKFTTTLLPVVLGLALPVALFIYFNVKRGKFTNLDVSDRVQRKRLYYFILPLLSLFMVYEYAGNGKPNLENIFLCMLLLALMLSNYWIKSSMHTALNIYVAAMFYNLNPQWGYAWLSITVLVGISRLVLKRHTLAEVISGSVIGTVVSAFYLWFGH